MGKSLGTFLLLVIKPLSKTADIWDFKEIIQVILVFIGWGGGGSLSFVLNFDLFWKWAIIFGIPIILLLWAGIRVQKKVIRYETPLIQIVYDEQKYKACKIIRQGYKDGRPFRNPLYSIGLLNSSKKTIQNVSVSLEYTDNKEVFCGPDVLRLLQSSDSRTVSRFDLRPSKEPMQFVEVLDWDEGTNVVGIHYATNYNPDTIRRFSNQIIGDKYNLKLIAQGDDVSETIKNFVLEFDTKKLRFYPE